MKNSIMPKLLLLLSVALFCSILFAISCNKGSSELLPNATVSSSSNYISCLPDNIHDLYFIEDGDTIKIYQVGNWHNKLLGKYANLGCFPNYSCGYNYMNHIDSMMKEIASANFASLDVYDYMELENTYTISDASDYYFACDDSGSRFVKTHNVIFNL